MLLFDFDLVACEAPHHRNVTQEALLHIPAGSFHLACNFEMQ